MIRLYKIAIIISVTLLHFSDEATLAQSLVATDDFRSQSALIGTNYEKQKSNKEMLEKKRRSELLKIANSLDRHQYRDAITRWERLRASDKHPLTNEVLGWKLAQAYVALDRLGDAIRMFERFYVRADALTIRERADIGEELIFGDLGARPENRGGTPIGKGQCTLCHRFDEGPHGWAGPNLFGIVARSRTLVQDEAYLNRSKATDQPEAFPGSGIATTEIEYLAESKVCPSCYITPGTWFHKSDWKDSPQPRLHRPPLNLTVDEMIAIDTWLFVQEREEPPPLGILRAAYDKFLKQEERAGSFAGIKLAALYDANNNLDIAVRLIAENYDGVVRQNAAPSGPSDLQQSYRSLADEDLLQWRNTPSRFYHLKQNSSYADRFPDLLRPGTR